MSIWKSSLSYPVSILSNIATSHTDQSHISTQWSNYNLKIATSINAANTDGEIEQKNLASQPKEFCTTTYSAQHSATKNCNIQRHFLALIQFSIYTHQQKRFTIQANLQCNTSAFNKSQKKDIGDYL